MKKSLLALGIAAVLGVSLVRVQQGELAFRTLEPIANNWLHGQAVKTPPFHGGNRGSNPLGVISLNGIIKYGAIAKW